MILTQIGGADARELLRGAKTPEEKSARVLEQFEAILVREVLKAVPHCPVDGGKKVYAITDAGRAHLADNRSTVDDVLERLGQLGTSIFGEQMRPAHDAMAALGRSYVQMTMHRNANATLVDAAVAILRRAASDLDALVARQ